MPGAMRKLGLYLGLVEDDEERARRTYDSYDGYDDDAEGPPVRRYAADDGARTATMRRPVDERVHTRGSLAVDHGVPAGARPVPAMREEEAGVPPYRITTLHPRTYNEARTIGEHFRDGTPVIMNLNELDDTDAKRLVDFAAGLVFGLRGDIEKVTSKVFLLTPANVDVTAEDKARIAEGGFFNQS